MKSTYFNKERLMQLHSASLAIRKQILMVAEDLKNEPEAKAAALELLNAQTGWEQVNFGKLFWALNAIIESVKNGTMKSE
jgi:hypothetical protein